MQQFVLVLLLSILPFGISLSEVREKYAKAEESPEITENLFSALSDIKETDDTIFLAYKGAVLTLKAKHSKGIKHKKEFFKNGVALLESALSASPNNLEIHFIRLTVQENAPKIVRYNKQIEADKRFILENYNSSKDDALKKIIKKYSSKSTLFSENEKQLF